MELGVCDAKVGRGAEELMNEGSSFIVDAMVLPFEQGEETRHFARR